MRSSIEVLLVEDSRADARLILEVFKDENIDANIEVARDGEEAMALLQAYRSDPSKRFPDLIILDLNLPKKDGREVLAEIKKDDELKSIPIVVLTTSQSEEDISQSYKLHANCYVTKPIDLQQFVEIIKALNRFWFSFVSFPSKK
jgi:chemotaxis family two-component system response regulator Rcp1